MRERPSLGQLWPSGNSVATATHKSLARARQIFDEVPEGSHGDLGRWWIRTAIFEIALREAEQVIGDSTPGRGAEGVNPSQ